MVDFSKVAFQIPKNFKTVTIETEDYGDLILREPVACDYALVESLLDNPNLHERTFAMTMRLAVSLNGESGVTEIQIGMLDRFAYKRLVDLITQFFLDVMPDTQTDTIQKFIQDKWEQFQQP